MILPIDNYVVLCIHLIFTEIELYIQTMLHATTWKKLHDTTKFEWDDFIPTEIKHLDILIIQSFFL